MAESYDVYNYNSLEIGLKAAGHSEKEICEADPFRIFTSGVNDNFPGCGEGWCCIIKS